VFRKRPRQIGILRHDLADRVFALMPNEEEDSGPEQEHDTTGEYDDGRG
jgi:hypothetical protein